MTNFERLFLSVVDDYERDHGLEGVLEEFFPGMSLGELLFDMYSHGMIPQDRMEEFLGE